MDELLAGRMTKRQLADGPVERAADMHNICLDFRRQATADFTSELASERTERQNTRQAVQIARGLLLLLLLIGETQARETLSETMVNRVAAQYLRPACGMLFNTSVPEAYKSPCGGPPNPAQNETELGWYTPRRFCGKIFRPKITRNVLGQRSFVERMGVICLRI